MKKVRAAAILLATNKQVGSKKVGRIFYSLSTRKQPPGWIFIFHFLHEKQRTGWKLLTIIKRACLFIRKLRVGKTGKTEVNMEKNRGIVLHWSFLFKIWQRHCKV